jgi:cytosine/adenosine deaminase-related metal-dependent hydrolase
VDLIIANARQLVTLEAPGRLSRGGQGSPRRGKEMSRLGLIENGAVAVRGDRIVDVGTTRDVLAKNRLDRGGELLDASGRVVCPGFVDVTPTRFAGQRALSSRCGSGRCYMDIAPGRRHTVEREALQEGSRRSSRPGVETS